MKSRLLLMLIPIFAILACSCSNNADDIREGVSQVTEPPVVEAADVILGDTSTAGMDESQTTQTEAVTEATEAVSTISPTTEATTEATTQATMASTNPTTQPTTMAVTAPTTKSAAKSTKAAATSATNSAPSDTATSENEDSVVLDDEEEVLEPVVCGMITHVDEQYTDYIIYQGVVYISFAGHPYGGVDGFYNNLYIPGDKLMEISVVSSNRELAELSDGTASVLPVGTEIYTCQNQWEFILALVGEEYIPYFGIREG